MARSLPLPWNDRTGKLSPLKLVVFVGLFVPGTITAVQYFLDELGSRPLTAFTHWIGLWTFRLLLITLMITPLRQIFRYPGLINLRRMLGVGAAAYIGIHFTLYTVDQAFDLGMVASEIVHRFYLTIGFIALLMLAALAATSTDGMVRRLGAQRWQLLHRLVYPAAILGVTHYFIQAKADVWEPTIAAGILIWMALYRVVFWLGGTRRATAIGTLLGLAFTSWILTVLGEATFYWARNNVDPMRVIDANFKLIGGDDATGWLSAVVDQLARSVQAGVQPRPGWVVLILALLLVAAAVVRNITSPAKPARSARRPAPAAAE